VVALTDYRRKIVASRCARLRGWLRKLPIVAQQLRKWLRKVITTVALASYSGWLVALAFHSGKAVALALPSDKEVALAFHSRKLVALTVATP